MLVILIETACSSVMNSIHAGWVQPFVEDKDENMSFHQQMVEGLPRETVNCKNPKGNTITAMIDDWEEKMYMIIMAIKCHVLHHIMRPERSQES